MKIPLSWLRDFVDLPDDVSALTDVLDDLGLVVEGVERLGEGLDDVVVARVEEIRPIKGADRIRLVVVDAGQGPLEIVCGASNFEVGNRVPLAPVGAVLPDNFVIARRSMKGVVSNGMLCSARELHLSEDHEGLLILDGVSDAAPGTPLREALGIVDDVVLDLSVEGNRPDAWSVEGVARDLCARLGREFRPSPLATPTSSTATSSVASARLDVPEQCTRLTVSVLENVTVTPSPTWVVQRLAAAGMRAINNVVDASNYVMLETGQPTHPYDADRVAGTTLGVRLARNDEVLVTLDGVARPLAQPGRGLGDGGDDVVIVDGSDTVLGLAGIMGGEASEISEATSTVLIEAACFDPMTVARSSKRHGLHTEASHRFERGVDPTLALRAVARFVEVLRASCPDVVWLASPLDLTGHVPIAPTITLRASDVERVLGTSLSEQTCHSLLRALRFDVEIEDDHWLVTPPPSRPDIRSGVCGRADVIEEIARLYSYRSLARTIPTWTDPGHLSSRAIERRRLREAARGLGLVEAWTPSFVTDADASVAVSLDHVVRVTNPLVAEESVLRPSMVVSLVRAWAKNNDRTLGDLALAEYGVVFSAPEHAARSREERFGSVGGDLVALPGENERFCVVLGRDRDDATTAVAVWSALAQRMGLADVVVRSTSEAPPYFHPTRAAALRDRRTDSLVGWVGEVDPDVVARTVPGLASTKRLGLLDVDLDVLFDHERVRRVSALVSVPSRYPLARMDLAFVVPRDVNAQDLAHVLRNSDPTVEDVRLFDVYSGESLGSDVRSLAYAVRLSSNEQTLSDRDVARVRETLLDAASSVGATLR